MRKIVLGLTGASGSVYGKRLAEVLVDCQDIDVQWLATDNGKRVFSYEIGQPYDAWEEEMCQVHNNFHVQGIDNLFAGIASGSYTKEAMVICPCSMGTLAQISQGIGAHLLTRAADVSLKEGHALIIVPRETPMNTIHLENQLRLARAGAIIMPAMPGFYHRPDSLDALIDHMVGKICDRLGVDHHLYEKWKDTEQS